MKIGILTACELRHRYFVHALRGRGDVAAVCYERVGYSPAAVKTDGLPPHARRIVAEHFAERRRQENVFFGDGRGFLDSRRGVAVRQLPPGTLNTASTRRFLEAAEVDTVVVYGTNLIGKPLLSAWPGRMINVHLGLSPYYRGTATNFYPLVNGEPEYVGATIHLIDAGIDRGPILAHARPEIVADDMPHTIGCKAILAGIVRLIEVLSALARGPIDAVPQWPVANARLYLRKDYHPRHVVELYRRIDDAMIRRYVERAAELAARVRLVELTQPSCVRIAENV